MQKEFDACAEECANQQNRKEEERNPYHHSCGASDLRLMRK